MHRNFRCIVTIFGLASISAGAASADSDMPTEPNSGPPTVVLTERARAVHRAGILIDGHNDLPWRIRRNGGGSFDKIDIAKPQPSLRTDIPRLKAGGVGGQFWVVYIPPSTPQDGTARTMALEQFDLIHRMVDRYDDVFALARTADDVERIRRTGKIASLIGIEGGHMIESSLDTLREFYERGARYMSLTHTESVDWADSSTDDPRADGLSKFGEQVVLEMNRLGMLVDLAHVSFDCMRDVLRVSKAPVIASHSGAYAVAQHVRNVPDDVIKKMAERGGVVMIVFFPGYVDPQGAKAMSGYFETQRTLRAQHPDPNDYNAAWGAYRAANPIPRGGVQTVVDHIDHIVKLVGVDHVGLGGDYEGVSLMPRQLEDVSGYPYITQELLNRGYSEPDIHKIMGGNLLRALREAERVSREWKHRGE